VVTDFAQLHILFAIDTVMMLSLRNPLSAIDTKLLSPDWATSVDLPIWMKASHRDMLLAMQRLLKKTILDYLKRIPAYARPSYNFRYISLSMSRFGKFCLLKADSDGVW